MVVKVYISNATIYTAAKKNQQHVLWLLSGLKINHEVVDVGDNILEDERTFLHEHGLQNKQGVVVTPQIFNDDQLCGDFDGFQLAIENESLFEFLKTEAPDECPLKAAPAGAPAPAEEAPAEEAATEEGEEDNDEAVVDKYGLGSFGASNYDDYDDYDENKGEDEDENKGEDEDENQDKYGLGSFGASNYDPYDDDTEENKDENDEENKDEENENKGEEDEDNEEPVEDKYGLGSFGASNYDAYDDYNYDENKGDDEENKGDDDENKGDDEEAKEEEEGEKEEDEGGDSWSGNRY